MTSRQARVGENQSMFREINETVERAARKHPTPEPVQFLCECADEFCGGDVPLTLAQYEAVRAHSDRFIVCPGHFTPDVEQILEEHADHWVVEKFGEAEKIAEDRDPRE